MGGRLFLRVAALVLSFSSQAALCEGPVSASSTAHRRVAEARERGYWVVAEGDHLFRISRLLASDESEVPRLAQELHASNSGAFMLGDRGKLVVGARLRLPERYRTAGAARSVERGSAPGSTAGSVASAVESRKSSATGKAVSPVAESAPAEPPVATAPAASPSFPTAAPVIALPLPSQPSPAPVSGISVPPGSPSVTRPLPSPRPSGAERAVPFDVTINSAKAGTWLFVERGGELYAPRDAFDEWRVQLSDDAKPIDFKGQKYWPLSSVPGFKSRVDFASQSVDLLFSPEAFSALRLTTEVSKRPPLSPVLPSVFFNYDVNYNGSRLRDAPSLNDLGVIAEVGVSGSWGVLTSTQVGRNLTGEDALGNSRSFLRLDTTLTHDFPDKNVTLRVGDSITRAGVWGRNVFFGGIQVGTNFALTPGFITQPLPTLLGTSVAPSTVELYINDVLRQVSSVPTGPFAIDNFPLMTGSGEARLVVRDLLGRETVIVQPFFANSRLLATGLSDWSFEAGTVRQDYGNASNNYGSGFAGGMWRHGYSDELTVEGRAEASRQVRTLGLGFSVALPWQFLGSAAYVASDHEVAGRGSLWVVGVEREQLHSSFAFQAKGATSRFHLLGQDLEVHPFKLQLAGNWTYYTDNAGSVGLGFATISGFDDLEISTVSGNYSVNIGSHGSLTLTATRAIAGGSGTAVGLSYMLPLERNRIASASATRRDGRNDAFVTASQNPTVETDRGWRLLAGKVQDREQAEGGLYFRGRYGTISGEVSASRDQSTVRLGTTGGVVMADGNLFVTRRMDQGFAVAEVKGYPNVGIGLGSTMLTRTDANGVALIPDLWPYTKNSIRINPNELPVNAQIESIEQVAVPSYRGGVKVTFPVRGGRGALLKIVLEDGEVAPPGAIVVIEGDSMEHYVARRGESFVTGLEAGSRVLLKWKDRQCVLDVVLPPEKPEEFPRVGPLLCKGVTR